MVSRLFMLIVALSMCFSRLMTPELVLISATLTRPSLPRRTFFTMANFQELRGTFSACISTTSPTLIISSRDPRFLDMTLPQRSKVLTLEPLDKVLKQQ